MADNKKTNTVLEIQWWGLHGKRLKSVYEVLKGVEI